MQTDSIITASATGLALVGGTVVALHGNFRDESIAWAFKLAALVLVAATVAQLVRYSIAKKKSDSLLSSVLILVGVTVALMVLDRLVTFDFAVVAERRQQLSRARAAEFIRNPIAELQGPPNAEPGVNATILDNAAAHYAHGELEKKMASLSDTTDLRVDAAAMITDFNKQGRRPLPAENVAVRRFLSR